MERSQKSHLKSKSRKLCQSIACPKALKNPTVHHGKMYEQKASKQLEERYLVKSQNVSLDRPCLGASPDAVIGDDAIVEVKCLMLEDISQFHLVQNSNS